MLRSSNVRGLTARTAARLARAHAQEGTFYICTIYHWIPAVHQPKKSEIFAAGAAAAAAEAADVAADKDETAAAAAAAGAGAEGGGGGALASELAAAQAELESAHETIERYIWTPHPPACCEYPCCSLLK